jgi:predicted metalloprotease with PDZ domain
MSALLNAQTQEPLRYTVRFPEAKANYASVEAEIPVAPGAASVEVFLPVWTPGSYLVREFARNVDTIKATADSGKALSFETSRKNRWLIHTAGASRVHFAYRVYCHEMSVRTNWVESGFALLNGAPTFVSLVGGTARPHDVKLELPAAWKISMTGLPEAPDGAPHHYLSPDYDTLVDSPILAGNPTVHRFEVDGIPHYLVNQGEEGVWDGARSAADVEKLVRHYREMWGGLPYRKYVFLNLLTESGGGLEHRNSVCMMASRWATRSRSSYIGWLALASHEYFHAWNVKRLRPVELGPFDYENENPTRSLWVAEGITDYYGSLGVLRTGLSTRADYIGGATPADAPAAGGRGAGGVTGSLSRMINELQHAPGRKLQSAEQASLDAWIRYYRPNENSGNTGISYYTKGAVVGWLLDAKIRKSTNGRKSLDDLMRLAFSRFSEDKGYTPDQFKATAEEVAGTSLREFFRHNVESTEELDYNEALDWFGLRFRPRNGNGNRATIGAETKVDGGRLLVSRVPTGSAAQNAGLNVDDEILAIGEFRVRPDGLATRLGFYKPGDKVMLLIARRDKLERLELTLDSDSPASWQLEVKPDATQEQKTHLEAWLSGK